MNKAHTFYACTPGKRGVWHDLASHLHQTAALWRGNAAKFGTGELAYLAGLWHDVEKFNPEFKEYLKRCARVVHEESPAPTECVLDAVYGAILAMDSVSLLAPLIYGHHAGLPQPVKLQSAVAEENTEVHEAYERLM